MIATAAIAIRTATGTRPARTDGAASARQTAAVRRALRPTTARLNAPSLGRLPVPDGDDCLKAAFRVLSATGLRAGAFRCPAFEQ